MVARRWRGAFVMAHGRQELLDQTVEAIRPQVDTVMVLDNASDPRLTVPEGVGLMYVPDQPPNLAKWWNLGFDFFKNWFKEKPYDLAVLCDDSIVPDGWFDAVVQGMRMLGVTAASTNPWGRPHGPIIKRDVDGDISNRMCSWAFVIDGASEVRADESMHWWWFDTDFDIACRRENGTALLSGPPVPNQQPNHYTNIRPELAEQAGRDREAFAAKHAEDFPYTGGVPW